MKTTNTEYRLKSFLGNVNKLIPGKTAVSEDFGRVTCLKAADRSRNRNDRLHRSGYGTRLFSMSKSKHIPSGKYTLGKLRSRLAETI